MNRLGSLLLLGLIFAGCGIFGPVYSSEHPRRPSRREICAQAEKNGWCGGIYAKCRNRAISCCEEVKNIRCNRDGMCSWEGCGALFFGMRGR